MIKVLTRLIMLGFGGLAEIIAEAKVRDIYQKIKKILQQSIQALPITNHLNNEKSILTLWGEDVIEVNFN